jgi:hypothetical protein
VLAAAIALGVMPVRATAADDHGAYAIIVNPGVTLTDVSASDVTRLLLGERRFWTSGLQVTVLLPPAGSAARAFLLQQVFHMNEATYRRHTLELLYRGELEYAPKIVDSLSELFAFTAASPGAVTIVPAGEDIPATVRVLHIDGRVPGSPDYAYRY